jgi:hypothetical protein
MAGGTYMKDLNMVRFEGRPSSWASSGSAMMTIGFGYGLISSCVDFIKGSRMSISIDEVVGFRVEPRKAYPIHAHVFTCRL